MVEDLNIVNFSFNKSIYLFSKGKSLRTVLFRSHWFKDKVLSFRFIILNSIEIILHLLRQLNCEVNITRNRLFLMRLTTVKSYLIVLGIQRLTFDCMHQR